jgi:hypothetical protein
MELDAAVPSKLIKSYSLAQENGNIDFTNAVMDLHAEDLGYSSVEVSSPTPPLSSPKPMGQHMSPKGHHPLLSQQVWQVNALV